MSQPVIEELRAIIVHQAAMLLAHARQVSELTAANQTAAMTTKELGAEIVRMRAEAAPKKDARLRKRATTPA